MVSQFFLLNPSLCAQFAPCGNGPENDLLAYRHRKIIDQFAGEISALVATFVLLLTHAGLDRAHSAIFESFVGKAALACYFLRSDSINRAQSFLELQVVVPVCDQNGADSAIESARGQQLFFYHRTLLTRPRVKPKS
jgi:hypothetical protein